MQRAPTPRNENKRLISLKKRFDRIERKKMLAEFNVQTRDLENAKIALLNVLEDLHAEKEVLATAKAKDDALLESIGEGMIAVDNDKKVIVLNKVACDMLGWKAEDLIGKVITDLPLEDEAGNAVVFEKRPTTMALKTGKIAKVSYFFVKKDKTRFPIAITATPIMLNGKSVGLIEIIRDVTLEKEIDKAKTEFVSLASHQLRTPLTAISWYTEMLLNGDVGNLIPAQRKYLEEIHEGNRRMVELVNTLLDVSRIELGTFNVELKPTDVIALAESAVNDQKLSIENKKIIFSENFSKDIPMFLTDPKFLYVIFQNLLTNAITYTAPGGRVEFFISSDDKKAINIKVSDTGYGIPKNQQDRIFTKLFRADNAKAKDTNGTGLGLYIVKSIVENFGGRIWFESPASGSVERDKSPGTIFYVTLPFKNNI